MNKKYIVLISIIVVLSISLVLTVLFKDKGYSIPNLKAIKTDIVNIEITKAGETIKISKKDGLWFINDEYNANQNTASNIVYSINSMTINDLVSRGDEETMSKYSLDSENVLSVVVFDDKNKEVRNFAVGSKGDVGYQVYGQIDKDKNIYTISSDNNLRDLFDKNIDGLRNRTISSVIVGNINNLGITKNDTTYTLNKVSPEATSETNDVPPSYWQATWNNNETVDSTLISSVLYALANIEANGFLNDSNQKTEMLYEITINSSDKLIVFTLFNANSENQYEISLDGDSTRYFISEEVAKRVIDNIENILK